MLTALARSIALLRARLPSIPSVQHKCASPFSSGRPRRERTHLVGPVDVLLAAAEMDWDTFVHMRERASSWELCEAPDSQTGPLLGDGSQPGQLASAGSPRAALLEAWRSLRAAQQPPAHLSGLH
eukprot:scaffold577_cov405-Prasinococcus_capsulatus_cf.AAC.22